MAPDLPSCPGSEAQTLRRGETEAACLAHWPSLQQVSVVGDQTAEIQ